MNNLEIKKINENYSWILNLGVVPLFLLAFFLLTPVLATLFFLFVSVRFVSETIKPLLQMNVNFPIILTRRRLSVKAFLAIVLISSPLFGSENPETIIMSIGEHKELPLKNLVKYTISNGDCLTHKYLPKNEKMLLKGNKLGYSELVVWTSKSKETFRIYILNKQKQLEIVRLAQALEGTGAQIDIAGELLILKGEIQNLKAYLLIKKLEKEHKETIILQTTLSQKLRNLMIGKVYSKFYAEYKTSFSCESEFSSIICQYSSKSIPSKNTLQNLKERFYIDFIQVENEKAKNYVLKFKILQWEKLDGEELNFGLDKIEGNLGDLFHQGLVSMIEKNQILLNKSHIALSSLAEPETVITASHTAIIEVGSEIAFTHSKVRDDGIIQNTEWKFAGLRVKMDLQEEGEHFKLLYETEFSRPTGGDKKISGSKEKSTITIDLNSPVQIFQIGFKTEGEANSSMPILSSVPILGEIFKSKSKEATFKKITGVIVLEEYESAK